MLIELPLKCHEYSFVYSFEQEHLTILVGTNDLSRGGQHYKVSEIIPHKNYHHGVSVSNDIGLIRVEGTIKFSALVQPIRLSKEKVAPNSILQLSMLYLRS